VRLIDEVADILVNSLRRSYAADAKSEGLHERAGAVEALIEADIPLQVHHWRKPRTAGAACGVAGPAVSIHDEPSWITCESCRTEIAKVRARRGARRRKGGAA
jgi:hypothetical protein